MRSIVLSMIVITFQSLFAQDDIRQIIPVDINTQLITYREVIDQKGTPGELFNQNVYWLNNYYANPWGVTSVRDAQTGVMKGRHQFPVYYFDEEGNKHKGGDVYYEFKIEFKENRYRYTMNNFVLKTISRYPCERWLNVMDAEYNEKWDNYLKQIDAFVKEDWAPALKKEMLPEVKVEEEDW